MATNIAKKTSSTAQEIIRSLEQYYGGLSRNQDISILKYVICLDASQIIYFTSEYNSNGIKNPIRNQNMIVDAKEFNEIVNGLSRKENLYLSVKGYKTYPKEVDIAVFVEIPATMVERRKRVTEIICSSFFKNHYACVAITTNQKK